MLNTECSNCFENDVVIAELKRRIDSLFTRQMVKDRMFFVLRQLLTNHPRIFANSQTLDEPPIQDEPLRQEMNPEMASELVIHWITYYISGSKQNCDINARACWATLCGNLNRRWVFAATIVDPEFNKASLCEWSSARENWLIDPTQSIMFVRFIDSSSSDGINGHSVVSYKYKDKIWTFQAFCDVCILRLLDFDIFGTRDGSLIKNLMNNEPLKSCNFYLCGVDECNDKHTVYANKCRYLTR